MLKKTRDETEAKEKEVEAAHEREIESRHRQWPLVSS